MYSWDCENCPLYRVVGCPLIRGCLSIEMNGRTVGTFRIVCYIMGVRFSGVSVKRGSTVHQTPNPADLLVQIAVFDMEVLFFTSKQRCQYCKLVGKPTRLTQRKCPDCIGEPALCQTTKCDCHSMWHSPSFDGVRSLWFAHHQSKQQQ